MVMHARRLPRLGQIGLLLAAMSFSTACKTTPTASSAPVDATPPSGEKVTDSVDVIERSQAAASGEPWSAKLAFEAGGHRRESLVFFPGDNDGKRSLILLFHGLGDTAENFATSLKAAELAHRLGVIIAVPQGLLNSNGGLSSWNAGACCAFGDPSRNDAALLDVLPEAIGTLSDFDKETIDVAGFSNGGFFSEYLACKHSDKIRGAMNVGGSRPLSPEECTIEAPQRFVRVHGVEDDRVPFEGGDLRGHMLPSFEESFVEWRSRLLCSTAPELVYHGVAACRLQSDCVKGDLLACSVPELGHSWPSAHLTRLDVLEHAWQFWQGSAQDEAR